MSDYIVPEGVTVLTSDILDEYRGFTSIVIPEGVTEITSRAFYGCKSLTSITLPKSLRTIGYNAFNGCTGLTEIIIPEGVTEIASRAFDGCGRLTSITLPKSLRKIGEWAFVGCFDLTEIIIPEGVTEIASHAFDGCTWLTSITLPKSLRKIGEYAFGRYHECENLSEVHISDVAAWCEIEFEVDDSNPLRYAKKLYLNGDLVENLVIPEGVTEIASHAFSDCQSLTSITLPKSLRKIGTRAFSGCVNLSEVHISDIAAWCGIKLDYGSNPLKYAKKLYVNGDLVENLVIPEGVTEIASHAFNDYTWLTSITLPKSLRKIGGGAFDECNKLSEVHISDIVAWCEIEFESYSSNPLRYAKNLYVNGELFENFVVPEGVTEIVNSAFKYCRSLTSITLPKSLRKIGEYAFYECGGLTEIIIPEGVTEIASHTFDGCTWLTSITLPKSLRKIGEYAFYECTGLTTIIIPEGVTEIAASAFSGCKKLETITLPKSLRKIGEKTFEKCRSLFGVNVSDIAAWCEIEFEGDYSNPLKYAHNLCLNDELVVSLIIPEGVTKIASFAFKYCTSLTSITLPKSLRKIGKEAFKVYNIHISDIGAWCGIEFDVEDSDKESCNYYDHPLRYAKKLYLNNELVTNLVIPEGVTEISTNAFYGCKSLTSITLPKSLRKIETCAFEECKNLSDVHISNVAAWCEIEFGGYHSNPLEYAKNLYVNGELFENFVVPEGVTEIDSSTFKDCKGVTSITLPKSLRKIGEYAFYGCAGLTEIVIPEGVTEIVDSAFEYCKSLTSITLPKSLRKIGKDAFEGCAGLTEIVIPEGVTEISTYAFSGCKSLTSITLPKSLRKIGEYAFKGCENLSEVHISDITAWCEIEFHSNPLYYAKKLYVNGDLVENLVIPEGVTEIASHAFNDYTWLTSITLPKSLRKIGEYAFHGCGYLSEIIIPEGLTEIGKYAFHWCKSLTSIKLPKSLRKIGEWTFDGCKKLSEVHISDITAWCGIEFGGYHSNPLYYAKNLYLNNELVTTLVIPEGVTEIVDSAFEYCQSLTSITLPKSLRKIGGGSFIGSGAFNGCENLSEVHISDIAAWLNIEFNSNPLYYAKKLYLNDELVTNLVIPEGVTEISKYAFYGCKSLTSIKLPKSLRKIGEWAFDGCKKLSEVHISDITAWCGIEFGGYHSNPLSYAKNFYVNGELEIDIPENSNQSTSNKSTSSKCSNHKKTIPITIPEGVTEIDSSTFKDCKGLTAITLPKSLRKIGWRAFDKCNNLSEVHISDIAAWCSIEFNSNPLRYAKKLYLNNELVTNLVILEGVTEISADAFQGCKSLTSITLPKSLRKIGKDAFEGCAGLTEIVIPEGVTEISAYAFYGCNNLTSITLPKSLRKIGEGAFKECKNLSEVHISDIAAWCSIEFNSNPLEYAKSLYLNGELVTTLVIPEEVLEINYGAFSHCEDLTTLIVPNNLCKIGSATFLSCKNLTTVLILNSVEEIGENAFEGCSSLLSLSLPQNTKIIHTNAFKGCISLTSLTLPEGVAEIGGSAFYGCNSLTSITLPKSLRKVGWNAFAGCKNLSEVHISDLVAWCDTEFGDNALNNFSNPLNYAKKLYLNDELVTKLILSNGKTNNFRGHFHYYQEHITTIVISEGVTEILPNEFSFYNWYKNLTSVTLPKSLRKIGEYVFAGCIGLTEIIIPEDVTEIGASAFSGCEGLTSIVIPEGVTEIAERAFKKCYNLTSITLPTSLRKIEEGAFSDCDKLTSIAIPKGVTEIGPWAFNECNNLSEVNISDIAAWCNIEFGDYCSNPLKYAKSLYLNGELVKILVIPEGVTEIGAYAFQDCRSLTSITLPKSLRKIGLNAFARCENLSEVHISDIASWCEIEFKGSPWNYLSNPLSYAKNFYVNGEIAENLIIPEGVTEIAAYAFGGRESLTSITLPTSLRKIGNKAFYGCKGLTSIVIPEGVTEITESTFEGCYNLASITLPKSLRKIEYGAFKECENLSEVHISDITTWCNIESEEVIENPYGEPPQRVYRPRLCAKSLYLNGELITNLIIPKDVKRISPYSFYGYENIVSVVISEGVIEIGEYAFSKCTRIETVTLPKSLEMIQRDAFSECENLSQVHFSQITSLQNAIYGIYIGPSAFSSCTALHSVTIYSVSLIDCHAFSGCTSLTTITIFWLCGVYISEKAFASCTQLTSATFFNIDKLFPVRESIISLARNVNVYKHIQEIRTKIATYNADTVNIHLPDICLPYIDYRAFEGCTRLTSIIFDANPSSQNKQIPTPNISEYAFDESPNLMKFAFPYSAKDKFIHPEEYCKTHRLESSPHIKLPFDLLLLRSGWDVKRTTEESQDEYDEQDFSSDYDEGPHEVWDWIDREDLSDPDDPLHNL